MNKVFITPDGYDNLKRELDELICKKRPQAVERLHKARSMGDLKENSEYSAAKEGLAFVEGRIREIEEIFKNVEVVKNHNNTYLVSIGSVVTIETDGTYEEYCIVGDFEADPINKKLSHTSPIGCALLGKKIGDMIEIKIPAGSKKCKIVTIK